MVSLIGERSIDVGMTRHIIHVRPGFWETNRIFKTTVFDNWRVGAIKLTVLTILVIPMIRDRQGGSTRLVSDPRPTRQPHRPNRPPLLASDRSAAELLHVRQ